MDNITKDDFIKGYKEDKKYAYIIAKIKRRLTNKDDSSFFRTGYPFVIINNLLYKRPSRRTVAFVSRHRRAFTACYI